MDEFKKLCAKFREEELAMVRKAFAESDEDRSGTLSINELRAVLVKLGEWPSAEQLAKLEEDFAKDGEGLDVWEFAEVVKQYREQARDIVRFNQGFSDKEVKPFQQCFQAVDEDNSGSIQRKELSRMLDELFPGCRDDASLHKRATDALAKVDGDHDGSLTFEEFLKMMRLLQDEKELAALTKEEEAINRTQFIRSEVKEFRQIFLMFRHESTDEMSFPEFQDMMTNLVPMGDKQAAALQNLLISVDDDHSMKLDFAEFLTIMQKVKDMNFGGINDKAEEITGKKAEDKEAELAKRKREEENRKRREAEKEEKIALQKRKSAEMEEAAAAERAAQQEREELEAAAAAEKAAQEEEKAAQDEEKAGQDEPTPKRVPPGGRYSYVAGFSPAKSAKLEDGGNLEKGSVHSPNSEETSEAGGSEAVYTAADARLDAIAPAGPIRTTELEDVKRQMEDLLQGGSSARQGTKDQILDDADVLQSEEEAATEEDEAALERKGARVSDDVSFAEAPDDFSVGDTEEYEDHEQHMLDRTNMPQGRSHRPVSYGSTIAVPGSQLSNVEEEAVILLWYKKRKAPNRSPEILAKEEERRNTFAAAAERSFYRESKKAPKDRNNWNERHSLMYSNHNLHPNYRSYFDRFLERRDDRPDDINQSPNANSMKPIWRLDCDPDSEEGVTRLRSAGSRYFEPFEGGKAHSLSSTDSGPTSRVLKKHRAVQAQKKMVTDDVNKGGCFGELLTLDDTNSSPVERRAALKACRSAASFFDAETRGELTWPPPRPAPGKTAPWNYRHTNVWVNEQNINGKSLTSVNMRSYFDRWRDPYNCRCDVDPATKPCRVYPHWRLNCANRSELLEGEEPPPIDQRKPYRNVDWIHVPDPIYTTYGGAHLAGGSSSSPPATDESVMSHFVDWVMQRFSHRDTLIEAFRTLDINGNGQLSISEFHESLRLMGYKGDTKHLWKLLKEDKNGIICQSEFLKLEPTLKRLQQKKEAAERGESAGSQPQLRGSHSEGPPATSSSGPRSRRSRPMWNTRHELTFKNQEVSKLDRSYFDRFREPQCVVGYHKDDVKQRLSPTWSLEKDTSPEEIAAKVVSSGNYRHKPYGKWNEKHHILFPNDEAPANFRSYFDRWREPQTMKGSRRRAKLKDDERVKVTWTLQEPRREQSAKSSQNRDLASPNATDRGLSKSQSEPGISSASTTDSPKRNRKKASKPWFSSHGVIF
eukprot:gnl/TRDRNA2_/TRDRNA2_171244_c1_seq3.p1 gnl/TRDRNA2_/TRDRNA2_171244_c1~~gnl/TRDRNA2_/TRDRNA2_171244_c1_seq3.p1  ORF type:complete len:1342 (+),score=317.67 gnl/TRDRNA2_/TRDRNA2_171244_c1_seq3:391-4026(+)